MAFAESYFSTFGEVTVKNLFAKHWSNKEKALGECESVLAAGLVKLNKNTFRGGCLIAARAISDKI